MFRTNFFKKKNIINTLKMIDIWKLEVMQIGLGSNNDTSLKTNVIKSIIIKSTVLSISHN